MTWLFSKSAARREALRERKEGEPPSGFDQVVWLIFIFIIVGAVYEFILK